MDTFELLESQAPADDESYVPSTPVDDETLYAPSTTPDPSPATIIHRPIVRHKFRHPLNEIHPNIPRYVGGPVPPHLRLAAEEARVQALLYVNDELNARLQSALQLNSRLQSVLEAIRQERAIQQGPL